MRSRYARQRCVLPPGPDLDTRYFEALRPFTGQGYPLICTSDGSTQFVSRHRETLRQDFSFVSAEPSQLEPFIDKRLEYARVRDCGVPLPKTVDCPTADPTFLVEAVGLPMILKPRTLIDCNRLRLKNVVVATRPALDEFLRQYEHELDRFVAQEVVPGTDDTLWVCNATFDRASAALCAMTFQRLGLSPSHFGVTTLAVSRRNDAVADYSFALARALNWSGPAMFEFKWDSRVNDYVYIEINPRLGMCNWFDTRCGINNVLATYLLSLGRESELRAVAPTQSENLYFVSLFSDVIARAEDGEKLGPVALRHLKLMLKARVGAWWYWKDPIPGIRHGWHETLRVLGALARRGKSALSPG